MSLRQGSCFPGSTLRVRYRSHCRRDHLLLHEFHHLSVNFRTGNFLRTDVGSLTNASQNCTHEYYSFTWFFVLGAFFLAQGFLHRPFCLSRFTERVASDKSFAVARETDPCNVLAVPASSRGGWFAFSMAPWSLDFDMAQSFSTANASCVHLATSFGVLRRPPKNEGPSRINRCHFPNCFYGVAHTNVVRRTKSAQCVYCRLPDNTHEFMVPP